MNEREPRCWPVPAVDADESTLNEWVTRLANEFGPLLWRFVSRLGVLDMDIPDVVQETLIKCLLKARTTSFPDYPSFNGWVFVIARHESGTRRRKNPKPSEPLFDQDIQDDYGNDGYESVERDELSRDLRIQRVFDRVRMSLNTRLKTEFRTKCSKARRQIAWVVTNTNHTVTVLDVYTKAFEIVGDHANLSDEYLYEIYLAVRDGKLPTSPAKGLKEEKVHQIGHELGAYGKQFGVCGRLLRDLCDFCLKELYKYMQEAMHEEDNSRKGGEDE